MTGKSYYVFSVTTKYVNNAYLRQLNICCSPSVSDICIKRDYPEGYPEVAVPFDHSQYENMNEDGKNLFWIDTIEKVFAFLDTRMKCDDDKLKQYITSLRESDIKKYKQIIADSYK